MQIILNQEEMMEAVKEMVHQQITINDDQEVEVVFETDEENQVYAVIEISKPKDEPAPTKATTQNKPRAKRGTRQKNTKASESSESSPSNENDQESSDSEKPPMYPLPDQVMTYDPQSEANGGVPIPAPAQNQVDPPPFDPDPPKPEGQPETDAASPTTPLPDLGTPEPVSENQTSAAPVSLMPTGNKIFPEQGTSAAATPVPEPDPATAAKSLFANLTRNAG